MPGEKKLGTYVKTSRGQWLPVIVRLKGHFRQIEDEVSDLAKELILVDEPLSAIAIC